MKKLLLALLLALTVATFFLIEKKQVKSDTYETRAVYFSYIEFQNYIQGKTEEESKENIKEVLDNIKKINFNRIIVHVRPFSDSIYISKYYPTSKYILNDKDVYPNYDVLEYFINEAHKRNIKFDAWINPYRISNLKNETENSVYKKYSSRGNAKITENGMYLNPASEEVQTLIVNGIKEIVINYDVDGIHFDDYFYPDKKIDLKSYEEYIKDNPNINLNDFRLNNVKTLIKKVYKSIKEIKPKVEFGIAPEGNIDNCYDNSYLDVKEILEKSEYVDYIMPQIYYGFNNQVRPFKDTVNDWKSLIKNEKIKLIPALSFYKVGTSDKYAGSGVNEWLENDNIISKEIEYLKNNKKYNGFSLFSYNYIFNDKYKNDKSNLELESINNILKVNP
ncbi:MAG: family 10 glycosylhydrolase [Bacilli bacterium]|nr:family 10 glycosylhydrolase [Bacilli bacterium]